LLIKSNQFPNFLSLLFLIFWDCSHFRNLAKNPISMKTIFKFLMGLGVMLVYACASDSKNQTADIHKKEFDNPLLKEWTGPYGGVPAFDKMDLTNLEEAIETGIQLH